MFRPSNVYLMCVYVAEGEGRLSFVQFQGFNMLNFGGNFPGWGGGGW